MDFIFGRLWHSIKSTLISSLRWPLLISLSGLVFLFMLFLLTGIFLFTSRNEDNIWRQRQQEVTRDAVGRLESFLQYRRNELLLIAAFGADELRDNPRLLNDFMSSNPVWGEIILVDRQAQITSSAYQDVALLTNLFTIRQSRWYIQASQGQTYLSDVQIAYNDAPYLLMAVPAKNGVVAARLHMDVLWEVISGIHFGSTGMAYLFNPDSGLLVAHPDSNLVLAGNDLLGTPIYAAAMTRDEALWDRAYSDLNGRMVRINASQVRDANWVLVTQVDEAEVELIRRAAATASTTGLILLWLGITLFANHFLDQWVLIPLKILRSGADNIGQGKLESRIPIKRMDEVGHLTEHFNMMAVRLEEQNHYLLKAWNQALRDSQFKSRMLANVSHELRTPLGVILGMAEMLRDEVYGPIDEAQRRPLSGIIESTNHLSQMVSNLLDQARLETQRLQLHVVDFSPQKLAQQVYLQMNVLAEKKGLTLVGEVDPALPQSLRGDVARLQQVLINLVGNAVKFTASGTVGMYFLRRDDEYWAVRVSDTGPGIPAEAHNLIFEPFHQLDNSPTRQHAGTGLGLSITQQLVSMMGGMIELESEVGKGSAFTVILPLDMDTEISQEARG